MTTYALNDTRKASLPQVARTIKLRSVFLWVLQVLLALLFVFAGVAKLTMPIQVMVQQSGLPAVFIRFIAIEEILGAFGLVLPGILRLRPVLTPLAASCLVVIMIGATVMTAITQGVMPAVFPSVVGSLLTVVIYARWQRGTAAR